MIVQPFRSAESDSVHTNTLCPEGKAIPAAERRSGDGGLGECDMCRALGGVRLAFGDGDEGLRNNLLTLAQAEVLGGFGVIIWRPGSDEILLSEGAYHIFGLTPTGPMLAAEVMTRATHPDDLSEVMSGLAEAIGGGRFDLRHRVVWPDGTIRRVRSKARLIGETDDNPEHLLGTVVDITDETGP